MSLPKTAAPATRAAQALGAIEPSTRGLAPAIHPATTYLREGAAGHGGDGTGYSYSRDDNPTYAVVEALIADLEGGVAGLVFASGMAAATAVFNALAPGDHVIAPQVMYWALRGWLREFAAHWGLRVSLVPGGDVEAVRAAVEPGATRLIWLETPANPLWTISDIAAIAEIAHGAGARLAVDNTAATPVLTRPIELGADIVMHSGTKYLGGHSDVTAGVLVTARTDDFWRRVHEVRTTYGGVLGPFEAWLLLRGMRTLFLRVEAASHNALAVAEAMDRDPRIAQVLYPGLPGHPGHGIAAVQMQGGFGAMLSIRLAGGRDAALATARALRVFKLATSLGGVESLVEHRASVEGPESPVPDDLLRLSVGIEAAADLIADLEQALRANADTPQS